MVKDLCFEIIEKCLNNCKFCSSNSNCNKTQIIKLHKINKPQKEKLNLYNLDDGIDILMNFINSKDKNKNEFE